MSSVVTCSVSSYPSTTIATESPTRIRSAPAASTVRADGASYAVTMTRGSAAALAGHDVGRGHVRRLPGVESRSSPLPPPSRARSAPGGAVSVPVAPGPSPAPGGWHCSRTAPSRRENAGHDRPASARTAGCPTTSSSSCDGSTSSRRRGTRPVRRPSSPSRSVVHLVHLAVPVRDRRRLTERRCADVQLACSRPCSDWRRRWFQRHSTQTSTS